jgi:hypothetical protein
MVMIRLTPVSGSGTIATLTFDLKEPSLGKIISLSARLANSQGTSLPVLVRINYSPAEPTTASDPPQIRETAAETAEPSQILAQTIIIAGQPGKPGEAGVAPDTQGTNEPGDRPALPEPGRETREDPMIMERKIDSVPMSKDAASAAQTPESTIFMHKSVLDRFKEYQGGRTPDAFVSLFEQDGTSWRRQDPPVALSDGKSVVRVTFISTPGNTTSSDVAVMGAKLISLKKYSDTTNTWVAELVPEKGEYRASLAIFQGEVKMVYPLTIAPEATKGRSQSGSMTKADFYRYFTGRGSAASPGFYAKHYVDR